MADLLDEYAVGEAWDEMFDADGHVRPSYRAMHDVLRTISPADLSARADALASGYTDQGVTFDIGGIQRPVPARRRPAGHRVGRMGDHRGRRCAAGAGARSLPGRRLRADAGRSRRRRP